MLVQSLREKHPRLHYHAHRVSRLAHESTLVIEYEFELEPGLRFTPEVRIPCPDDLYSIDRLAFELGMVELISYWKLACPPVICLPSSAISEAQLPFWQDLYLHGLGEFYFVNQIDFTVENFLRFEGVSSGLPVQSALVTRPLEGELILVGGGKDSCVTLEILKASSPDRNAFLLNPTRSSRESAAIAGHQTPLCATRTIDPLLLKLNSAGYLNGHTPFSAYLAFLGTLVGYLHGYRYLIASNEASANEENTSYRGLAVNHQYSKSLRFEQAFREYSAQWIRSGVEYFSFLRPLHELQIASLFAQSPQHLDSFRSCNIGQRTDSWCGRCPKCCFVYACLLPFVEPQALTRAFGADLFSIEDNYRHFAELAGISAHKPLECVGTAEEVRLALSKAAERYVDGAQPPMLSKLLAEIGKAPSSSLLEAWSTPHFLPAAHEMLLKGALGL